MPNAHSYKSIASIQNHVQIKSTANVWLGTGHRARLGAGLVVRVAAQRSEGNLNRAVCVRGLPRLLPVPCSVSGSGKVSRNLFTDTVHNHFGVAELNPGKVAPFFPSHVYADPMARHVLSPSRHALLSSPKLIKKTVVAFIHEP